MPFPMYQNNDEPHCPSSISIYSSPLFPNNLYNVRWDQSWLNSSAHHSSRTAICAGSVCILMNSRNDTTGHKLQKKKMVPPVQSSAGDCTQCSQRCFYRSCSPLSLSPLATSNPGTWNWTINGLLKIYNDDEAETTLANVAFHDIQI